MMMRRGMIEELGERKADLVEARPIQVAQDDALFRFILRRFDEAHLRAKILPIAAVVNETVHPGPKLRIHRIVQFALPPKMKWKVGIKVRKNNAWQQIRARPFE